MADVQIKEVAAIKVAALRRQGSVREIGQAFGELFGALMRAQAPLAQAPPIGVYYCENEEEFDPDNTTYDVCAQLAGDFNPTGNVEVIQLPAAKMASAVHKGPYEKIGPLYTALGEWMGANGFSMAGPVREIYLVGPGPGDAASPEDYVTEVQMPVSQA